MLFNVLFNFILPKGGCSFPFYPWSPNALGRASDVEIAQSRSREIQVNPRNPVKFTETSKIPRNLVEILSNTCLYSKFETCLSYWGYLQRSKTTRRRLCCEKLGTSHDVKGFAIGSFLERIVVERANDDLC